MSRQVKIGDWGKNTFQLTDIVNVLDNAETYTKRYLKGLLEWLQDQEIHKVTNFFVNQTVLFSRCYSTAGW